MIPRTGEVVIRMLETVPPATIGPLIQAPIGPGSVVDTDEYDIDAKLSAWGSTPRTVCDAAGAFARDEDGDGFCEVQVTTIEGFGWWLRSGLRPHRGISQEKLPLDWGFFECVPKIRKRGKALLKSWIELRIRPTPRNTG